jgi:peptide/nickel transport system substrate-binding protein
MLISPHSAAVTASIISPVKSICSARLRPIARLRATIGVVQKSPILTANQATVAQIVQAELKPLGITVNIQQLDPTAAHAASEGDSYEMDYSAWTMDIPDPDEWTSFAVDPSGGAKSAFTSYDNASVINLNKQAEQQTSKDAFLAYLFYPPYAYATTDKVHGFFVTPLGNFHLEDVYKSS